MQFASKRAWVPRRTEELAEEVDEDEITRGVRYTATKVSSPAPNKPPTPARSVRLQEGANTNVVSIPLGELKQGVTVMTGDKVECRCGAIFSHLSTTTAASANNDNNQQQGNANSSSTVWCCEFCGTRNEVSLQPEEVPTSSKVDFLLSGPTTNQIDGSLAYTVIFVVDVSGSMCCTVPVKAGSKLKTMRQGNAAVLAFREGEQYLPNERHGEQYVSRLECVVAAVEAQVEALKKSKPNVRVGLVTFASDVCIIGDGTQVPLVVTGDRLSKEDELIQGGAEYGGNVLAPISQSAATVVKSLRALEENGTTALGPGLCVALGMLRGAAPGSKIVVLTDGLANTGVGSLEAAGPEADSFYRRIATQAKDAGYACSVVAIKGSQCKMEILGMLADASGGEVDIVDPTEVHKNFANILEDEVFATDTQLKMLLHQGMYFLDPDYEGKSCAVKQVGNITELSSMSFEYRVRTDGDAESLLSKHKGLPFQVQIRYRRLDGSQFLRVVTEMQEITAKREEAEADVNVDLIASNAVQQAAHYSASGNYAKARSKMVTQQRMMARATPQPSPQQQQQQQHGGYARFVADAAELDDALLEQEAQEHRAAAPQDEETRRSNRNDTLSNAIYKGKAQKSWNRK